MTEYINKESAKDLIENAIEDSWELDYTLERLEQIKPSDVVERSKIDKTIEEMERYSIGADYENEKEISNTIDKCVEILKRNIRE